VSVTKVILNIFLVGFSSLVGLVGVEITLRHFHPQILVRSDGLFVPDDSRSFKLKPDFSGNEISHEFAVSVNINSKGLRDDEIEFEKPENSHRVLVLGDSFTFGNGVSSEHTYSNQLEELLIRRQTGQTWQVINSGISGYGTFQEYAFLEEEGWQYEPDVVILQFLANNDLTENLYPFRRVVRNGQIHFKGDDDTSSLVQGAQKVLQSHSHAYRFFGDHYHLIRIQLGLDPFFRGWSNIYDIAPSQDISKAWEITRDYLDKLSTSARTRKVDFYVINVPPRFLLDDDQWQDYLDTYGKKSDTVDRDLTSKKLQAICAELQIPLLDLTPYFRELEDPLTHYHQFNGHWNQKGHRRVAQWVYDFFSGFTDPQ
jgi:lysophospholipase L1-like esterase